MGVTIRGPHVSIDMGYFGFARLKRAVAGFLGDEVKAHYEELFDAVARSRPGFYADHDAETARIYEKSGRDARKALDFLYAPDVDGRIAYGACAALLRIFEAYESRGGDLGMDVVYGYPGWKNPATFADFVAVLRDCAESKKPMKWD